MSPSSDHSMRPAIARHAPAVLKGLLAAVVMASALMTTHTPASAATPNSTAPPLGRGKALKPSKIPWP